MCASLLKKVNNTLTCFVIREEFKDEEMPDVKKLDIRNFL
jgi:hypothetical protein